MDFSKKYDELTGAEKDALKLVGQEAGWKQSKRAIENGKPYTESYYSSLRRAWNAVSGVQGVGRAYDVRDADGNVCLTWIEDAAAHVQAETPQPEPETVAPKPKAAPKPKKQSKKDAEAEAAIWAEHQQEIATLKGYLSQTDYKAIKYAEGWITEEEYAETKAQRQAWRDRINELEHLLTGEEQ